MRILQKARNRFASVYEKYGWKAVAGVFTYYLVRDVTLYIVIPYWALSKI